MRSDTRRRVERYIQDLRSPDPDVSSRAEKRLIRFGPKAVDALIAATADQEPQVRYKAVWALGKIGDRRAYPAILALLQDPDEGVRYDAAYALGVLRVPEAIPILVSLLCGSTDDSLLDGSAQGLGEFGWDALPALKEKLRECDVCRRLVIEDVIDNIQTRLLSEEGELIV